MAAPDAPDPPAPWPGRPAWIEIDLDAVAENVRRVAATLAPGTRVMAVVKAEGYGLGAAQMAAAAQRGGATWLAVAAVDEGAQLRRAGLGGPILALGPTTPWEMRAAVAGRLTITVNDLAVGRALSLAAEQAGVRAPVHLKLDTGLHRFGRAPDALLALAREVAGLPGLRLEGLYTHFANADDPHDDYAARQLATLLHTRARLAGLGVAVPLLHAAGSAGILALPASHLDLARVGIMLTGHYPATGRAWPVDLLPVVAVRARLARVSDIPAGATVGYGRTYTAPAPRRLGLVPLGYADGYHRLLSNRAHMLVGGRRAPVVGRVSMDQLTLDVTDIPDAREGDPVVVVGRQGSEQITFDDLAALAETISYELLTHLGKRLPRVYLRGGEVTAVTTLLGEHGPAGERPAPPPPPGSPGPTDSAQAWGLEPAPAAHDGAPATR
jgi:alanine racemase